MSFDVRVGGHGRCGRLPHGGRVLTHFGFTGACEPGPRSGKATAAQEVVHSSSPLRMLLLVLVLLRWQWGFDCYVISKVLNDLGGEGECTVGRV